MLIDENNNWLITNLIQYILRQFVHESYKEEERTNVLELSGVMTMNVH